jgi:hypothetical protein
MSNLQNQSVLDAIAAKIVRDLQHRISYSHESRREEIHSYNVACLQETEGLTFADIWEPLINSELENLYNSLEKYSQADVRNYVKEVYLGD